MSFIFCYILVIFIDIHNLHSFIIICIQIVHIMLLFCLTTNITNMNINNQSSILVKKCIFFLLRKIKTRRRDANSFYIINNSCINFLVHIYIGFIVYLKINKYILYCVTIIKFPNDNSKNLSSFYFYFLVDKCRSGRYRQIPL